MIHPINAGDWRKLREHVDTRIADLQRQLEGARVSETETALLRGRIAELRNLIAWGEPAAPPESIRPIVGVGY